MTDNAILRQILFQLTGTLEGLSTNSLLQRISVAWSNGVYQFRQFEKPTTRPDGTALSFGDRWYSMADNIWFFWAGFYWLSEQLFRASNGSSNVGLLAVDSSGFDLFIERFEVAGQTGATNTEGSYAQITLERRSGSSDTVIATVTTGFFGANTRFYMSSLINLHLDVSALELTSLRAVLTSIGGGSSPTGQVQGFRYRFAKP